MTPATPPPGPVLPTFRDPAGSLSIGPGGVVRSIAPVARKSTLDFLASPFYQSLVESGALVASTLDDTPSGLHLHHPKIPVPTYPWEWTPAQWLAAADLTLQLAEQGLAHGWLLKDATPLNILFLGNKPILVDVLSFDPYKPGTSIWLAYGQYVRTFLLPLIANRLLHWPLSLSLFKRDGYEPADLYAALSWPRRLSAQAFWPITLPALLEKRKDADAPPPPETPKDPGLALHILNKTFVNLRKRTHAAIPSTSKSEWADYEATRSHYTVAQSSAKFAWVQKILTSAAPKRVLDIGANTGEFSILAASLGADVVSLERDAAAADRLFQRTRLESHNIQTIHADLARPTPAAGWDNRESLALLPRLEGQFDLVLMLAVIHHLILMEQIPLSAILDLIHRLTTHHLILEWVPPTDPMYQSLMRGRDDLYGSLTSEDLLAACHGRFHLIQHHMLDNGRTLYHFAKI